MPDSTPLATDERITGGVHVDRRHDSAHKHVTGEAVYIDDIREPAGLLHVYLGLSDRPHAKLLSLDLSKVKSAPGVVRVLTSADVPGTNDVSCMGRHDEPLFADDLIEYAGQPLFAVAAETRDQARRAARLAVAEYEDLDPVLTTAKARETGKVVFPPMTLKRGDAAEAIAAAPRRLEGRISIGGQDHFYLEGQIAMAIPGEDDEVLVHSSTQHPSEVQHIVAHVLNIPANAVSIEVRRMGGAFGGKETQANLFAATAALVAKKTGRAAKLRPDRDDDMVITGKRHDFEVDYIVGFDDEGRIKGVDFLFAARCGFAADLSGPVTDRALFHCDNTYFYEAVHAQSLPLKTNTVSNTAFRGFGGPQGMVAAERMIEEIAYAVGKDPLEIRKLNFYGEAGRDVTPVPPDGRGQHRPGTGGRPRSPQRLPVPPRRHPRAQRQRRLPPQGHRADAGQVRHLLHRHPVQSGRRSRPRLHRRQRPPEPWRDGDGAGALRQGRPGRRRGIPDRHRQGPHHRDHDRQGTQHLRHRSILRRRPQRQGRPGRGPHHQGTPDRLRGGELGSPREQVVFLPNRVRIGNQEIPFADLVRTAYMARIQLSSTGFYKTPEIHWDRAAGSGKPFYYFSYGAAAAEVTVDTLTGEYRVDRVDILHDVGKSLNPALDRGQVEGGFVQGMGWLTMEELWWDQRGHLRTHAPSTYKIPACSDRPKIFNVHLLENSPNSKDTIYRSKAVGEPPLMLGMSVLHAISDAVASVADYQRCPRIDPPATPEKVLAAIEALREQVTPP